MTIQHATTGQGVTSEPDAWLLEAATVGASIDLTGCRYRSDVDAPTPTRYHLLAGIVRTTGASRILEIGTFHGGAIMAMARGVDPSHPDPQIVTVDVVAHNDDGFRDFPQIHRILRDSLSPRTVEEVTDRFDDHIDLLFIDSGHDYRQTFENMAIYGNVLKPRMIVLDDIRLNQSMARMWESVVELELGVTRDISDVAERQKVGCGLILPRYPSRWPEMHRAGLGAWRAYWGTGRVVMPFLSTDLQARLRRVMRGQ